MAASNFQPCLAVTLSMEGGYSTVRSDPGNWTGGKVGKGVLKGTMKGIAASSHPNLDIKNLTDAQIAAIYVKEYWVPVDGDTLPVGPDLATFDFGVQSGPSRGKAAYTAARATTGDPLKIVELICARRMSFLRGLAIFKTMGKGLARRVATVEAAATKMAASALGKDVPATLQQKADAAGATATKQKAAAGASATGAVVTPAAASDPSNPWLWVALGILAVCAVIIFLKSRQHEARAQAFAAAAQGA